MLGGGGDAPGTVEEGNDVDTGDPATLELEGTRAIGGSEAEGEGTAIGTKPSHRGLERGAVRRHRAADEIGQPQRCQIPQRCQRALDKVFLAARRPPAKSDRQRAQHSLVPGKSFRRPIARRAEFPGPPPLARDKQSRHADDGQQDERAESGRHR